MYSSPASTLQGGVGVGWASAHRFHPRIKPPLNDSQPAITVIPLSPTGTPTMHIGELASRTGASAKAIRLYEEQGLLGPVPRQGVYRVYGERHLQQVLLIRQAQSVGFRLAELHPLLAGGEEPDWPELYQRLQDKRAALRAEIRRLQRLDAQLGRIGAEIHACIAGQPQADPALCATEPAQRSALLHEA